MMTLMLMLAVLAGPASEEQSAPVTVSLCDVLADRAAYNHKTIVVAGFVSHGFEDFTFFDPRCPSDAPGIWLEYGGTLSSGTIYCCGVSDARTREAPLTVDGIPVRLTRNANLKIFDALLQKEPDVLVRATIQGRFFSGEKQQWPGGTVWAGYGHFGMFSLLAIENVIAVERHDLANIDYRSSPDQPSWGDDVCFVQTIGDTDYAAAIQQQERADAGAEAWRFKDHRRVASEVLTAIASGEHMPLEKIEQTTGRVIYRAPSSKSRNNYMVVVSRPYWLTSTAVRRNRIAWVSIAAYEYGCDDKDDMGNPQP